MVQSKEFPPLCHWDSQASLWLGCSVMASSTLVLTCSLWLGSENERALPLTHCSVESSVSAFSGGLVLNHHLSVSDDLHSVKFENYLLHHLFKLCLRFKCSLNGKWAQIQREWKQEVCGCVS